MLQNNLGQKMVLRMLQCRAMVNAADCQLLHVRLPEDEMLLMQGLCVSRGVEHGTHQHTDRFLARSDLVGV